MTDDNAEKTGESVLLERAQDCLNKNDHFGAAEIYRQLCERYNDDPGLWGAFADSSYACGNLQNAAAAYLRRLELMPDDLRARFQLACSYMDDHKFRPALEEFHRVLAQEPGHARALCGLGVCLLNTGDPARGAHEIKRAINIEPGNHVFHFNYGFAKFKLEHYEEALEAFERSLEIKPDNTDALYGMGNVLAQTGKAEEAREYYRRAVEIEPRYYAPYMAIGHTWRDTHLSKAIEFYEKALAVKSDADDALGLLAEAFALDGRISEANRCFEGAIRINPENPQHYFTYGSALITQGRAAEALNVLRRCLELAPSHKRAFSTLLLCLHYLPNVEPADLYSLHRDWESKFAHYPPDNPEYSSRLNQEGKLRVGFVSPDFRTHSVAYFLEPLLRELQAQGFDVAGYSNTANPDEKTQAFAEMCDVWRDIRPLSDTAAAAVIRSDHVNILIDLAGHTADNRLGIFTRLPAPVMATWLGYPNTTGLHCIKWRLVDELTDPPGVTERFNAERLLRIEDGFLCYQPPQDSPAVPEPPILKNGNLTFGCFNNFAKVSDEALYLWRSALEETPGSKLLLKSRGLDDKGFEAQVLTRLANAGIAPHQVEFLGRSRDLREHLQCYNRVDIALDSWPYHGTTTTFEALWMGVPVVTLAGVTHASRVGVSILSHLGLDRLIARKPEDFARICQELQRDLVWLRDFRAGARDMLLQSKLLNAVDFARRFGAALRRMWREHQEECGATTHP